MLDPVFVTPQIEMRLAVVLCVCAALTAAVRAEPAADVDELARFRAEYPAAEAKLEEAYSHVRIDASETTHDPFGHFRFVQAWKCYRDGASVGAVNTCVNSVDPNFPSGAEIAFGGTSSKYFELYKDSPSSPFKFIGFGKAPNFEIANRRMYAPLYCAFAFVDLRPMDFIGQKDVTVVSANATLLDGQQSVEVVAELARKTGGPLQSHFYFQLPNWALMGYVSPLSWSKNPGALRGKIEYEPGSDPPKVKNIDKWVEMETHPDMKSQEENWRINEVTFGSVDNKEFDISAFEIKPTPLKDATTQPDTRTSSGNAEQSQGLNPNNEGPANITSAGIEVPVPVEANTLNTSPIRLATYSACAIVLGILGVFFGIRAYQLGKR